MAAPNFKYDGCTFQAYSTDVVTERSVTPRHIKRATCDLLAPASSASQIIYAAGLFDYLDAGQAARLIQDCHGLLAPGGPLIIGNFSQKTHPSDRILMGWLLEWRLLYRSEADYRAIFAQTSFGSNHLRFEYEALRANLFVLAPRHR